VTLLVGLVGVIVGALIALVLAQHRAQTLREEMASARADLAVRDSQLASAQSDLARVQAEHEAAITGLEATFESLSHRVLSSQMESFTRSQHEVQRERDEKLGLTIQPLATLLSQYEKNLADFGKEHAVALEDVKKRAGDLLEAQRRTQEETSRLNQILGRSDQRGRWGEIQLANVLERSGLREGIDYSTQVTTVTEARVGRPDFVVNAPGGWKLALDSKFPFDRFEKALASSDADERRTLFAEHARALRAHIKTLGSKAYWEGITPAPQFVVCFVPSDYAISAALEADAELLDYAGRERVLLSGPTNLLGLLWSVAAVVRHHDAVLNQEKLLDRAGQIFDRLAKVFEPVAKMGESLNRSVENYNKMVRSLESRLLPAARDLRTYGGAHGKELPALSTLTQLSGALNEGVWGVDPESLNEGASEILDVEPDE
jgi:DNA recombination protein RmuC